VSLLAVWSGWKRRLQMAQVCAGFLVSFGFRPEPLMPLSVAGKLILRNRPTVCYRHREKSEGPVVKSIHGFGEYFLKAVR
jgi:hypothetical protein